MAEPALHVGESAAAAQRTAAPTWAQVAARYSAPKVATWSCYSPTSQSWRDHMRGHVSAESLDPDRHGCGRCLATTRARRRSLEDADMIPRNRDAPASPAPADTARSMSTTAVVRTTIPRNRLGRDRHGSAPRQARPMDESSSPRRAGQRQRYGPRLRFRLRPGCGSGGGIGCGDGHIAVTATENHPPRGASPRCSKETPQFGGSLS
jgi:hypothetical protein